MALPSSYLLRETGGNLARNIVMTVAAVVTMAVSLTALGGVLIMRQAVNKATVQYQGGVELDIFLNPNASAQEVNGIREELVSMTPAQIKKCSYVDKTAAFTEFKQMFSAQPDMLKVMTPARMPTSFRCVPAKAQSVGQLAAEFSKQPGVYNVGYPGQEIRQWLAHFATLRNVTLVVAGGVMIGAIALVVNTIQLAIFARRREVAVMKLVGATNWFIRVPFMLEGLVEGLVGAAVAFVITFTARNTFASFTGTNPLLPSEPLNVSSHEALLTGVLIVVVGAAVGALGSGFAVRRHLSV
ncbi:MAG: permease-like cell division protein FtsX [Candidatus Dormibacteraeota bacterium]|nr:permease-like cell division protein FtsX [Candidatus Dormibacteraeota bacterium]